MRDVAEPKSKRKLWYQLIAIALTQWSHARCLEHLPALLRGCAALDDRTKVDTSDYRVLIKLLLPMQLERFLIEAFGLETTRAFNNNLSCLLVELATHGDPSVEMICDDFKVSPSTVQRVVHTLPDWCYLKRNSPTRVLPTDVLKFRFKLCGVGLKWK